MKVEDLFKLLSYGELSNLAMSHEGSGEIEDKSQPKIITYANEGLLRLYSRFMLRERELLLELHEGITNYHLMSKFARSNCSPKPGDVLYIRDDNDPFGDDLIRVLEVRDMHGIALPLNDADQPDSVFTPHITTLQVPDPKDGLMLSVMYQAQHRKLEFGVKEATVFVPEVLKGALTAFIAHKVFHHMGGQDNSAKAQEHMATFNQICGEVSENDLTNNTMSNSFSKLHERGFV